MIPILFYSFIILNIYYIFKEKQNKIFASCLLFTIILLYSGNIRSGYADLTAYRTRYESNSSLDVYSNLSENGYGMISNFFSSIGVGFQCFLLILIMFAVIVILFIVKKCSEKSGEYNPNIIVVGFSLFYVFFVMEGIRFFWGLCISLIGFYILSTQCKFNKLIFALLLLLASTFQSSFIFLLPFVFFDNRETFLNIKKNKIIIRIGKINVNGILFDEWTSKALSVLFIISIVLVFFNLTIGNSSNYLIRFFDMAGFNEGLQYRISFYTKTKTRLGWIPYSSYQIFNTIIIYKLRSIYNLSDHIKNDKVYNFLRMTFNFNAFSFIFIPFIMFNVTFFRYSIICTALVIISCGLVLIKRTNIDDDVSHRKYGKAYWTIILCFTMSTMIWWYMKVNVYSQFEALLPNVFNFGMYDSIIPKI